MKIYVCNYATAGELAAEIDDPDHDLDSMACPRFARITTCMSGAWVQTCKEELIEEVSGEFGDEETDTEYRWESDGWVGLETEGKRSYQTWDLYYGDEIVGKLTIQDTYIDGEL